MTGHHSGDIGDIIYGIPAFRAAGIDSLALSGDERYETSISRESVNSLTPLLESQGFDVLYPGYVPLGAIDLNAYRDGSQDLQCAHLSLAQAKRLGVDIDLSEVYLHVTPHHVADVVVHRSPRYHCPQFDWASMLREIKDVVFVGFQGEHRSFEALVGREIAFYKVKDFLDMARVIRGAKVFIGNQSSPFAIAEGLKTNRVQETCRWVVNAIPQTANGIQVMQPRQQGYAMSMVYEWLEQPHVWSEMSSIRREARAYCRGKVIDIGCGGDKVVPWAVGFDREVPYTNVPSGMVDVVGDARDMTMYADGEFDTVVSSHLLEDFADTERVLDEWLRILKPDGHLVLYLPNERRYRKHCDETGQEYNNAHTIEDMSLEYMLRLFETKPVSVVHTIDKHGSYSFFVVVRKSS